jgi:hypothetical protein
MDRKFRFGVVATPGEGGAAWRSTARRVAELGYGTLLMPDGLQLLAPFPSLAVAASVGAERLAQVALTIDFLRELDGPAHTPVLMAAGGPRARALAAAKADIVALAAGPLATRDQVAQMVAEVREHAGERAEDIELAMNLFVIGEQVPPWVEQFIGADAATLMANDSLTMLRGDTIAMADELQRRREELGVSYVSVNAAFVEQLAPVVELLTGR